MNTKVAVNSAERMSTEDAVSLILEVLRPMTARAEVAREIAEVQRMAVAALAQQYQYDGRHAAMRTADAAVARLLGIESRAGRVRAAINALIDLRGW